MPCTQVNKKIPGAKIFVMTLDHIESPVNILQIKQIAPNCHPSTEII